MKNSSSTCVASNDSLTRTCWTKNKAFLDTTLHKRRLKAQKALKHPRPKYQAARVLIILGGAVIRMEETGKNLKREQTDLIMEQGKKSGMDTVGTCTYLEKMQPETLLRSVCFG